MNVQLQNEEFSIGEVAKFFFDQNTTWLRRHTKERNGAAPRVADPDGTVPGRRRENGKLGGGDRMYSMEDVARLAANLHRCGLMGDTALETVMDRVKALSTHIRYTPYQRKKKGMTIGGTG